MKYLAYGMNTNSQNMMTRCPGATCLGPAYLPNFELVCRYHFDIDHCNDHVMQVVLWDIPEHTLKNLDSLEGYPYYYDRIMVTAYTDEKLTKPVDACIYIMTDKSKASGYQEPSLHYLTTVRSGYLEHGLDINQINKFTAKEPEPNLAEDLFDDKEIKAKVKASKIYAQNLYAALCNTEWQNLDVFPILKDQRWHCSWRSAGGIIATLREEGDYIDWYCSGIRNVSYDEEDNQIWDYKNFVTESHVTDEIAEDLRRLGWACVKVNL